MIELRRESERLLIELETRLACNDPREWFLLSIERSLESAQDAAIACAYEACAKIGEEAASQMPEHPAGLASMNPSRNAALMYVRAIRHLAPQSARNALALRELKAKREEADWWHDLLNAVCEYPSQLERAKGHVAALDAQMTELVEEK